MVTNVSVKVLHERASGRLIHSLYVATRFPLHNFTGTVLLYPGIYDFVTRTLWFKKKKANKQECFPHMLKATVVRSQL